MKWDYLSAVHLVIWDDRKSRQWTTIIHHRRLLFFHFLSLIFNVRLTRDSKNRSNFGVFWSFLAQLESKIETTFDRGGFSQWHIGTVFFQKIVHFEIRSHFCTNMKSFLTILKILGSLFRNWWLSLSENNILMCAYFGNLQGVAKVSGTAKTEKFYTKPPVQNFFINWQTEINVISNKSNSAKFWNDVWQVVADSKS